MPSPGTDRRKLIDVALGRRPAELVVRGGRLVNTATAEIYDADVAVANGRIAAVGDIAYAIGDDTRVIDASGRYVVPGLVEGHMHSYHSYLGIREFVESILTRGVTAIADGFYGQGIVGGIEAVRFWKRTTEQMPIRLLFLVPTVGYLQNRRLGLTPAHGIQADDLFEMLDWDGCLGLEEPPSGEIVDGDETMLRLFEETLARRMVITGHAMDLDERRINAYAAAGVMTDHESTDVEDALIKARAGIKLLAREGSGALNVAEVVRVHTERGIDPRALAFCVDLASPDKLMRKGALDENVRVAISRGVAPIRAIQMATLNVAEIFYRQHDIGVIAPGRRADILLVSDLVDFQVEDVYVGGEPIVRERRFVARLPEVDYPRRFYGTVRLARPLDPVELAVRAERPDGEAEVRVIAIEDGELRTREARARLAVADGVVLADLDADVLCLAMVDRFDKGGRRIGRGFATGFGLRAGAIGSSVNSVCENLVAVGTNPADMATALNALAACGGGKVVVRDGEVLALVELPLLGLLSDEPLPVVLDKFERAFDAIRGLGCDLENPFSQLEFCFASGEMGDLKLSDEGLLRVDATVTRVRVVVGES